MQCKVCSDKRTSTGGWGAYLHSKRQGDRDDDRQALGDCSDGQGHPHREHVEHALLAEDNPVQHYTTDDEERDGRQALAELVHAGLKRGLALLRLVEDGADVPKLSGHASGDDDAHGASAPDQGAHKGEIGALGDGQ